MSLLAHAGGGDEMLLVLVPVLVFMVVHRLVRGPLPPPEGPTEGTSAEG